MRKNLPIFEKNIQICLQDFRLMSIFAAKIWLLMGEYAQKPCLGEGL